MALQRERRRASLRGGTRRRCKRRGATCLGFGLALVVALVWGCASGRGGFDPKQLEARYPTLAAQPDHRLADSAPYLTADAEGGVLFLCRWSTNAPIAVALPADASERERELLGRALSAWEGAGLGVRFREVPRRRAQIELRFSNPEIAGRELSGNGETRANCAVSSHFSAPPREPVVAELSDALVLLRRYKLDTIDRRVPLSEPELLGTALHELGHALGYPGHAGQRGSVMSQEVEVARKAAAKLLAGDAFAEPSLAALYAVPSGAVVGRIALDAANRDRLEGLATLAASRLDLRGPFVRVGGASLRILWQADHRVETALDVRAWPRVVAGRERLELVANSRARLLLEADAADPPER